MRYLLFFLALSTLLQAQTPRCTGPSYAQLHRDADQRDVRLTCVIGYPGGGATGLLIGGMIGGDLYLSRRTADGEQLWEFSYATGIASTELTTLNTLLVDREGMIAGTGSLFRGNDQHAFVFRFDPITQQLLYLREATFESDANTLVEATDGSYLLTGARLDFPAPLFLRAYQQRIDRTTGAALEEGQLMDVDGDERIFDAVPHPEGGYVVTGQAVRGGGAGSVRTMIARMDEYGQLSDALIGPLAQGENARLFGYDVEVIDDRIYVLQWGDIGVLTGSLNTSPILTALDLNGEVIYTRLLNIVDYDGEVGLEMEAHNDGLLIYGYVLGRERDVFLMQTIRSGQVQWASAYLFPGRGLLYVRSNQQLQARPGAISVLATYVFNGGRSHEGLLLQLDGEGNTRSDCVERRPLTVTSTPVEAVWSPVTFTTEAFTATYTPVDPTPNALSLEVTDDCDIPCPSCTRQSFSSHLACPGESVPVNDRLRQAPGIFRDTLVSTAGGCDSVVITELVVRPPLQVAYEQLRSCGLSTAEVVVSVEGGTPPYTYRWSDPGAQGPSPSLTAGRYTVSVTDSLACQPAVISLTVDIEAPTFAITSTAPSCFAATDATVRLEPAGSGELRLLQDSVYRGDRIDSLPSGNYPLLVRTPDGCEVFREVFIPEPPRARLTLSGPTRVQTGRTATYTATFAGNAPARDYTWTPEPLLSCTDCPATEATLLRNTVLRVAVTDEAGCTTTDSLRVEVLAGAPRIFIPTAFSPNDDGLNDRWEPGFGPEIVELLYWRVFDRWGGQVWSYDPRLGTFWTGGAAGGGIYLYTLGVRLVDGRLVERRGEVTLVR